MSLQNIRTRNLEYIRRLVALGPRTSPWSTGEAVKDNRGRFGVIDMIFASFESAVDAGIVDRGWLEMQNVPPKTERNGFFYGVVHAEGASLAGELDLEPATYADVLGTPA